MLLLLLLLLGLWSIKIRSLHQSHCKDKKTCMKQQQTCTYISHNGSAYCGMHTRVHARTHAQCQDVYVKITQGLHMKGQGMQRTMGKWVGEGGRGKPTMLRV